MCDVLLVLFASFVVLLNIIKSNVVKLQADYFIVTGDDSASGNSVLCLFSALVILLTVAANTRRVLCTTGTGNFVVQQQRWPV